MTIFNARIRGKNGASRLIVGCLSVRGLPTGLKCAHVRVKSRFRGVWQVNREVSAVDGHAQVWRSLITHHATLKDLALLLNSLENGLIGEHHGCISDYSYVLLVLNDSLLIRFTFNFILLIATGHLHYAGNVE